MFIEQTSERGESGGRDLCRSLRQWPIIHRVKKLKKQSQTHRAQMRAQKTKSCNSDYVFHNVDYNAAWTLRNESPTGPIAQARRGGLTVLCFLTVTPIAPSRFGGRG